MPDIITCAKGITAGYAPLGAMIVSDRIAEPFLHDDVAFLHGFFTWSGHPVSCAISLKVLDIIEREGVIENVQKNEDYFRSEPRRLEGHSDRGRRAGHRLLLGHRTTVKDQATKETWAGVAMTPSSSCAATYRPEMFRRRLICRSDDRGDPVVQLAPPLISTREDIDFMAGVLREVFTGASKLNI